VHLGDADAAGDLGLGEVAEEPQDDDVLFSGGEVVEGGAEGGAEFGEGQVGVVLAEQVAQFGAVDAGADQGLQGDGAVGAGAFQAFDDLVFAALQVGGDVGDGGGAAEGLGQGGGGFVDVEFEFL
jgi:hypothetical protein